MGPGESDIIPEVKVCFETFGCRLNRAEALEEEARYLAAGWTLTKNHAEADWIVVRGCSVTARAQADCEKLVKHLKRKYPAKRVIVQGCLKEASPTVARRLPKDAPRNILERKLAEVTDVPVPTRTARAYLKVQDGCSGKCTFCIVPSFRGKSTSVPFAQVMDKARRFIDAGYHEIVVTGCNLALYASEGRKFPQLLAALAELGAADNRRCRIRIGSLEPGPCADETVRVMADHGNICRFLHIPVQSMAERLLVAMQRPYRTKDVANLVDAAIRAIPDIGLGCDLMTGFPGESDVDFLSTKTYLQRAPFSNVHVFPYSERPGTVAEKYQGSIPKEMRRIRAHELAKIADAKRQLFAQRFVHRDVEVVIEDETHQAGWTSEYLWYEPPHILQHFARKELVTLPVHTCRHGKLH